ncbi:hypothetical protein [Lentibacillus sp. CBA3610]|uniref:hypothetical protein n=1 Tax=Lentibacillus sp. CBA3610 TaxID=2518176 RepID=UPI001596313E|nr:hypothetical protein [Lentibacillus sp. CBA3610]QKY71170.1 hypothetical protein Len3610_17830 [Lentibacillus sp. CBA3610]
MDRNDIEQRVIESYQQDEKMMILVFAQWCINHDVDPEVLYERAYPDQKDNQALKEAMDLTVTKQESEEIADQTLLNILQVFENGDLAFVIQEIMADKTSKKR